MPEEYQAWPPGSTRSTATGPDGSWPIDTNLSTWVTTLSVNALATAADLGVLEPDSATCELRLTQIHPGVEVDRVRESTGWDLQVADDLQRTPPPTDEELSALRDLLSR